jgi:hypothetical protein
LTLSLLFFFLESSPSARASLIESENFRSLLVWYPALGLLQKIMVSSFFFLHSEP